MIVKYRLGQQFQSYPSSLPALCTQCSRPCTCICHRILGAGRILRLTGNEYAKLWTFNAWRKHAYVWLPEWSQYDASTPWISWRTISTALWQTLLASRPSNLEISRLMLLQTSAAVAQTPRTTVIHSIWLVRVLHPHGSPTG
ncbi:hypothetical protein CRM22_005046 [Opisthorchis felineus]|uniref:Uncharacterized protein n=1 Tax=Opisthorchis felineus TaxID=147828 RepID=A0A4S2LT35_OPIFE|nr:hypothetical protein CRM22_005046 [Opisthorchis felineus]